LKENGWKFWQYSQSGLVKGIPDSVDMSRFIGGEKDFSDFVTLHSYDNQGQRETTK